MRQDHDSTETEGRQAKAETQTKGKGMNTMKRLVLLTMIAALLPAAVTVNDILPFVGIARACDNGELIGLRGGIHVLEKTLGNGITTFDFHPVGVTGVGLGILGPNGDVIYPAGDQFIGVGDTVTSVKTDSLGATATKFTNTFHLVSKGARADQLLTQGFVWFRDKDGNTTAFFDNRFRATCK